LRLVYDKYDFGQLSITKSDVEKLTKLSHKEEIESSFVIGAMINIFLSYRLIDFNVYDSDHILKIANSLIPIHERLDGMIICKYLGY